MKVVSKPSYDRVTVPPQDLRENREDWADRRHSEEHTGYESRVVAAVRTDTMVSLALGSMLVGWALYAGVFIYLSSTVVGGVRYFLLFDDEMISMRYAANLAHGYGLVWNPHGVHVEGFTNPLWVFIMAFFHLLPVSLAKMSLLVELLALALGVVNLVLVWRLANIVSASKAARVTGGASDGCVFSSQPMGAAGDRSRAADPTAHPRSLAGNRDDRRWLPAMAVATAGYRYPHPA